MEENKQGMYILAIVAIIAIVGLVVMISGAKNAAVNTANADYSGQASRAVMSRGDLGEDYVNQSNNTGQLYVDSSPRGARITLDSNSNAGYTPKKFFGLSFGEHRVGLTLQGYKDYVTTVNIKPTQDLKLFINMTPNSYCNDSDGGYNYYVQGTVTWLSSNGTYLINKDYCTMDFLTEFGCVNGTSHSVVYNCPYNCRAGACYGFPTNETYAELLVNSYPSGAAVYIDSYYKNVTPVLVHPISVGMHRVLLIKQGYVEYVTEKNIVPGTNYLNVTLKRIIQDPQYSNVTAEGQVAQEEQLVGYR